MNKTKRKRTGDSLSTKSGKSFNSTSTTKSRLKKLFCIRGLDSDDENEEIVDDPVPNRQNENGNEDESSMTGLR